MKKLFIFFGLGAVLILGLATVIFQVKTNEGSVYPLPQINGVFGIVLPTTTETALKMQEAFNPMESYYGLAQQTDQNEVWMPSHSDLKITEQILSTYMKQHPPSKQLENDGMMEYLICRFRDNGLIEKIEHGTFRQYFGIKTSISSYVYVNGLPAAALTLDDSLLKMSLRQPVFLNDAGTTAFKAVVDVAYQKVQSFEYGLSYSGKCKE